jgi:hypothetical protein
MTHEANRDGPGDFGGRCLVGNFAFAPEQALDVRPRFGLLRDGQYVYGLVRDAAGNPHCLYRKIELNGHSWALSVQSRDAEGQLRIDREAAGGAYRGRLFRRLVADRAVLSPDSLTVGAAARRDVSAAQRGMELNVGATDIGWREDGAFDLRGEQVGPGMQWYMPHDRAGVLWLSVGYRALGSVRGVPVRGFLFFDHAYMPEGLSYPDHPLIGGLEVRWNTFANWYDDDCVEVGHFACGHENWGFALVNDSRSGVLHATSRVAVRVTERDAAGHFPREIEMEIGPRREQWVWAAEPGGDMVDFDRPGNPNSNGTEKRRDEPRRILVSMGWGETCPLNGDAAAPPD